MAWRDWYTHDVLEANVGTNTTLDAPLGHINVHVRDGSVILLHSKPGYTITETQASPYTLLISQAKDGYAFGTAYFDDGETVPPTPHSDVQFHVSKGSLKIATSGNFHITQKLSAVTVLGTAKPTQVSVGGKVVKSWEYIAAQEKLVISGLSVDFNQPATVEWK